MVRPSLVAAAVLAVPALAPALAQSDAASSPAIVITGRPEPDALPPRAGGQTARGGTVGVLGPLDQLDTPFSVQQYTDALRRELGARSPLDLLELDPSITRAIGVTEGTDQFVARGFVQFGFSSYLVNGLQGLGASQGSDGDLYERVELLKGPAALLFGGAAALNVGATVNLVTKTAPDVPFARYITRIESRSLWTNHVDVGRRFGADDAFGIRVNALHTGGHRNDDIRSGFKRDLASVDLDWRGDTARAYVHAFSLRYRTEPYSSVNPLTLDAPDLSQPPPKVLPLPNNSVETHAKAVQVGVDWEFARDTTLSLSGGRNHGAVEQPYGYLLALDPDTGAAQQINGYYAAHGRNAAWDATLRTRVATGPVRHRLAFNASRSSRREGDSFDELTTPFDTNVFDPVRGPAATRQPPSPIGTYETQVTSYGGVDTLGFFDDRLRLFAGLRRVKVDQTDDSRSKTSPGFAVLWKATPALSVYANRVQSLQPGETAPLNTGDPTDFVANPGQQFAPTLSKQWEAGAKWDVASRVQLTAAAFRIRRPSFFRDPVTRFFGPVGLQTNRGVELGFAGEAWRGVRLLGGYAYIDAKLSQTDDPALRGNRAVGVPRHTGTLSAEADPPFVPGLSLVTRLRAETKQQADLANTVQAPGRVVAGVGFNYRLPTTFDLVVRGFVDNVGDKRYYPSLARGRSDQAKPRTYGLTLEATL